MSLLQTTDDIRQLIAQHIKSKGITLTHLARKCECSTPHLSEILKSKRNLTEDMLNKINKELGTSFKQATPPPSMRQTA